MCVVCACFVVGRDPKFWGSLRGEIFYASPASTSVLGQAKRDNQDKNELRCAADEPR